ncbi:MAG: transcription antitermination factor NusB [Myxococcales bacterium]|nr:transcription antitermination factor NusB [Myxococcales bacterium]
MSESLVTRRAARALALQVLFAIDDGVEAAIARDAVSSWADRFELEADGAVRALATTLVALVVDDANRAGIDDVIVAGSRNWRLERMARVDRNILRLAVGEFLHAPATPARVVINEAVELAKRFGTAESPAFINGVLDRIAGTLGRRDVEPAPEPGAS